ncbi:MAG: AtpZ/AtpI family protein [Acidobacteriota bacterium]
MQEDDEKQKSDSNWRQAAAAIGLVLSIPWIIIAPALLGLWIDRRYGTEPLWFLICLFAGLLGAAFDVYKLLKRFGQFK